MSRAERPAASSVPRRRPFSSSRPTRSAGRSRRAAGSIRAWRAGPAAIRQFRSLLPAALLLLAAPAAAQPDFVTAPVTPQMAVAAVDECVWQIRAGAFDHQRLIDAGWLSVIRSDGGETDIRGYRHPDNMILLHIIDEPNGSDLCAAMAPTGRGLSMDAIRSALRERLGLRPSRQGNRSVWELDDLVLALAPMTNDVGVRIEVNRRSGDADARPR